MITLTYKTKKRAVMLYVGFIVFIRPYVTFDISRITSNLPTNFQYFSLLYSHTFPSYNSILQCYTKDNMWGSACWCSWKEKNHCSSGSSSLLCHQVVRLLVSIFILCNGTFSEVLFFSGNREVGFKEIANGKFMLKEESSLVWEIHVLLGLAILEVCTL